MLDEVGVRREIAYRKGLLAAIPAAAPAPGSRAESAPMAKAATQSSAESQVLPVGQVARSKPS